MLLKNKKTEKWIAHYFCVLDDIQKNIFLLTEKNNISVKQVSSLMKYLQKIRETSRHKKTIPIICLEELYEIIFSLKLLKNRVTDPSVLEICAQELNTISKQLSGFFPNLVSGSASVNDEKELDLSIQALEISFENTLQVVAPDPMVFLFFIQDLYALSRGLARYALSCYHALC